MTAASATTGLSTGENGLAAATLPSVMPPTARVPVSPYLIAFVIALATFMEVVDVTIAAVALPHIAGALSAGIEEATWVLTGNLIASSITLPLSGWLATAIGRKRFYMICVAGFTGSSMLCGFAGSLEQLILFRVIQGAFSGGMGPPEQAIITDTFPPEKRAQGFAVYGLAVVMAPALGPLLGGWLTEQASWRWVFFVNVPVGVLSLGLVGWLIRDPDQEQAERHRLLSRGLRIDWLGITLTAVALASLILFLQEGQDEDWFASDFIFGCAVITVVSFIALITWEWQHQEPVLELRLFQDRNFAVCCLLMGFVGADLIATSQLLPQFAQGLLGYTVFQSGFVLTLGALILVLLMPMSGALVQRIQPRWIASVGMLSQAAVLFFFYAQWNADISFETFALTRLVQMSGVALLFVPLSTAVFAKVPEGKNNQASALFNVSRMLGGSIFIAIFQALLVRRSQFHQSNLTPQLTAYHEPFRQTFAGLEAVWARLGAGPELSELRAVAVVYRMIQSQARMLAYIDVFTILAILMLAITPLILLMRRIKLGEPPAGH